MCHVSHLRDYWILRHNLRHYFRACASVLVCSTTRCPFTPESFSVVSYIVFSPFLFPASHVIMLFPFCQFLLWNKVVQATWAFVVSITNTSTGIYRQKKHLFSTFAHYLFMKDRAGPTM